MFPELDIFVKNKLENKISLIVILFLFFIVPRWGGKEGKLSLLEMVVHRKGTSCIDGAPSHRPLVSLGLIYLTRKAFYDE